MIFWESDLPNGPANLVLKLKQIINIFFSEMTPKIMGSRKNIRNMFLYKWMYSPLYIRVSLEMKFWQETQRYWKGCNGTAFAVPFFAQNVYPYQTRIISKWNVTLTILPLLRSREPCLSWQLAVVGSQVVGQLCSGDLKNREVFIREVCCFGAETCPHQLTGNQNNAFLVHVESPSRLFVYVSLCNMPIPELGLSDYHFILNHPS